VELWNTILVDVKAAKTAEAFKNGYGTPSIMETGGMTQEIRR
jgi:hypothetical protein